MFTTTLLQTFCKIILNSKVIVKSKLDPEDNFWGTIKHEWVCVHTACCPNCAPLINKAHLESDTTEPFTHGLPLEKNRI